MMCYNGGKEEFEMKNVLPKVFGWMSLGLLITFLTGYMLSLNPEILMNLSGTKWIIILIIELGLVIFLSAKINKMNPLTAKLAFLLYSFVSGVTFGTIFIVYELTSIIFIFLITAIIFAFFAFIGFVTKKDLSKMGSFLLMALIGSIICLIINMFTQSSMFDLIISIIIVLVFVGFTAYDMQKIKTLQNTMNEDNLAIYGALTLYLDYINIFIELLKLFGEKK